MVKRTDTMNKKSVEDSTFTYDEKPVKVLNSVVFTAQEKKDLENSIVDELYDIFTGKIK